MAAEKRAVRPIIKASRPLFFLTKDNPNIVNSKSVTMNIIIAGAFPVA
jgi:hypothetical protein